MKKNTLLKFAAPVLVSAMALAAQAVYAAAPNCADWSYNDPSCPAYIKQGANKAEEVAKTSSEPQTCADWSFTDSKCAAYIKQGASKVEEVAKASSEPQTCADWSYTDSRCSAYLSR